LGGEFLGGIELQLDMPAAAGQAEARQFQLAASGHRPPVASDKMLSCAVFQLGTMAYDRARDLQRRLVELRKTEAIPDVLLLCQHPHVITLGRNARRENLLLEEDELARRGVEMHATDRGGDVTYHGPGQLIGYPILDLKQVKRDVAAYMRALEEVLIRLTSDFDLRAERVPGLTGVWVGGEKLAAMGVHISRWVTSHGFALNVNTDLSYFDLIVPCGLAARGVTSLAVLLGRQVEMAEVELSVAKHFGDVFRRETYPAECADPEEWLARQRPFVS
jgi:lipoyl(octanoyl) transferase